MKRFGIADFENLAKGLHRPFHDKYYAMYSSVYGGVVTDPVMMMVPADDHLVHRGDGIFETFKCVNGSIYNLSAHLDRLKQAAAVLSYDISRFLDDLEQIIIETIRMGGKEECLIRVLVSRGPGSFDVNPYDSDESQLYVIINNLKKPFMDEHPEGATLKTSTMGIKSPLFATTKNCNYLSNALMKKEAVDMGADFVASFDGDDLLAEGATENIGIVVAGELLFPKLDGVLSGTTMTRVIELAGQACEAGELSGVMHRDISKSEMQNAEEILIVGTTPNIVAVTEFDGKAVGGGKPGPVALSLNRMLCDDIDGNKELLTKVF
jgi:branched-subunit amino acid aminotransferase/4-amino-4-deoxychorismate lyase